MEETRSLSLDVKTGLYVLRYLSSADPRNAPSASVRLTPGGTGDVDFVSAPGLPEQELAAPGSSIVLLTRRPGSVDIVLRALPGSSNMDARFSLDLLAAGAESSLSWDAGRHAADGSRIGGPGWDVAVPELEVEGHVARRGDVAADETGWIAGPRSPSPIEGLTIRCTSPGVGIAAQSMGTRERGRWSVWQSPASFVGTRQQADPLVGLRLRLVGPEAGGFQLQAETLFLGAPVASRIGSDLELTSQSGTDPLVGLRLALIPAATPQVETVASRTSRVRVFR